MLGSLTVLCTQNLEHKSQAAEHLEEGQDSPRHLFGSLKPGRSGQSRQRQCSSQKTDFSSFVSSCTSQPGNPSAALSGTEELPLCPACTAASAAAGKSYRRSKLNCTSQRLVGLVASWLVLGKKGCQLHEAEAPRARHLLRSRNNISSSCSVCSPLASCPSI